MEPTYEKGHEVWEAGEVMYMCNRSTATIKKNNQVHNKWAIKMRLQNKL